MRSSSSLMGEGNTFLFSEYGQSAIDTNAHMICAVVDKTYQKDDRIERIAI